MIRCSACPGRYSPLPGDGPLQAEVVLIGERPGQVEIKLGRPFVGPSGRELDNLYLPLAGLKRADCYVTNAVKCGETADRTPSDKEFAACSRSFLPEEIRSTACRHLILLGGVASRLVPGISLELHHGIPRAARLYGREVIVTPMYHTALGLHAGRWMTPMIDDWQALPGRLADIHRPRPKSQALFNYRLAADPRDLDLPGGKSPTVAIDTEDHAGVPWSAQLSVRPGQACLVRADNRRTLAALAEWVSHRDVTVAMHNAQHDLDVLARMGIFPATIRDTMQEAFHLGDQPQGLKPLAYRLFGFEMTTWEDVVRPASIEALIEWTVEALDVARADLQLIDVTRLKTKIRERVKKSPVESLFDRIVRNAAVDSDYNPWERLDAFFTDDANDWMTSHITARCGAYPRLGIANAPLDRAVRYGCGDADWTLRVARELAARRKDPCWRIDEGDRDL